MLRACGHGRDSFYVDKALALSYVKVMLARVSQSDTRLSRENSHIVVKVMDTALKEITDPVLRRVWALNNCEGPDGEGSNKPVTALSGNKHVIIIDNRADVSSPLMVSEPQIIELVSTMITNCYSFVKFFEQTFAQIPRLGEMTQGIPYSIANCLAVESESGNSFDLFPVIPIPSNAPPSKVKLILNEFIQSIIAPFRELGAQPDVKLAEVIHNQGSLPCNFYIFQISCPVADYSVAKRIVTGIREDPRIRQFCDFGDEFLKTLQEDGKVVIGSATKGRYSAKTAWIAVPGHYYSSTLAVALIYYALTNVLGKFNISYAGFQNTAAILKLDRPAESYFDPQKYLPYLGHEWRKTGDIKVYDFVAKGVNNCSPLENSAGTSVEINPDSGGIVNFAKNGTSCLLNLIQPQVDLNPGAFAHSALNFCNLRARILLEYSDGPMNKVRLLLLLVPAEPTQVRQTTVISRLQWEENTKKFTEIPGFKLRSRVTADSAVGPSRVFDPNKIQCDGNPEDVRKAEAVIRLWGAALAAVLKDPSDKFRRAGLLDLTFPNCDLSTGGDLNKSFRTWQYLAILAVLSTLYELAQRIDGSTPSYQSTVGCFNYQQGHSHQIHAMVTWKPEYMRLDNLRMLGIVNQMIATTFLKIGLIAPGFNLHMKIRHGGVVYDMTTILDDQGTVGQQIREV
ncbi:MAG: hypothetical protein NZO16_00220 [Deltaproteobacteria bacterium]|nr:hypothetical protein [Deltaproteobacteria bacterium]